jgi:SAM-dependent methyltransferase
LIRRATDIFRAGGVAGLLRATKSRMRGLLARPANSFLTFKNQFVGKCGIEVGGPSQVFSRWGVFPVYLLVEKLDNCNFSGATVWEGSISQGNTYRFDPRKPTGQQYVVEATDMKGLPSNAYDFVLSSHMLEHTANPILALLEWKRLLKAGGVIVLLLPDKSYTFDHRRSVTTLPHMIDDFNSGVAEDDLTHLPEILALHDLELDPEAGGMAAFKSRSMKNFENRCLHHHVFDMPLAVALVEHVGLMVKVTEVVRPHHLLVVAQNG